MEVHRKLGSLKELILIDVKNYSGYSDYKMRILLSAALEKDRENHCMALMISKKFLYDHEMLRN